MNKIYIREWKVLPAGERPEGKKWVDITDKPKARADWDDYTDNAQKILARTFGDWLAEAADAVQRHAADWPRTNPLAPPWTVATSVGQAQRTLAQAHASLRSSAEHMEKVVLLAAGERLWYRLLSVTLGEWRDDVMYDTADLRIVSPLPLLAAGLAGVCLAACWNGDPAWLEQTPQHLTLWLLDYGGSYFDNPWETE